MAKGGFSSDDLNLSKLDSYANKLDDLADRLFNSADKMDGAANAIDVATQKLKNNKISISVDDRSLKKLDDFVVKTSQSFAKLNKINFNVKIGKGKNAKEVDIAEHYGNTISGLSDVESLLIDRQNAIIEAIEDYYNNIEGIKKKYENFKSSSTSSNLVDSLFDKNVLNFDKTTVDKSYQDFYKNIGKNESEFEESQREMIRRREELYDAFVKAENKFNSTKKELGGDYSDLEKNKELLKAGSDMVNLAQQIKQSNKDIGVSDNKYEKFNSSDLIQSVRQLYESIMKKGMSSAFSQEVEKLSASCDEFINIANRMGKTKGKQAAINDMFSFVENITTQAKEATKETKAFNEEVKKAENYIDSSKKTISSFKRGNKTKSDYKVYDRFNKVNEDTPVSSGAATENEFVYVGEVANLLKNTGDKFKDHYGVEYFNKLIAAKPELDALAKTIMGVATATKKAQDVTSDNSDGNVISNADNIENPVVVSKDDLDNLQQENKELKENIKLRQERQSFESRDNDDSTFSNGVSAQTIQTRTLEQVNAELEEEKANYDKISKAMDDWNDKYNAFMEKRKKYEDNLKTQSDYAIYDKDKLQAVQNIGRSIKESEAYQKNSIKKSDIKVIYAQVQDMLNNFFGEHGAAEYLSHYKDVDDFTSNFSGMRWLKAIVKGQGDFKYYSGKDAKRYLSEVMNYVNGIMLGIDKTKVMKMDYVPLEKDPEYQALQQEREDNQQAYQESMDHQEALYAEQAKLNQAKQEELDLTHQVNDAEKNQEKTVSISENNESEKHIEKITEQAEQSSDVANQATSEIVSADEKRVQSSSSTTAIIVANAEKQKQANEDAAQSAEDTANRIQTAQERINNSDSSDDKSNDKFNDLSDPVDFANFRVLKQVGTLDQGAVVTYQTAEGQIGSALQKLDENGNIITEKISPLITNFEQLRTKVKTTFSEITKYQAQLKDNQDKYGNKYNSSAIEKIIANKELDLKLLLAQADIFASDERYAIEYKQFLDDYSKIKNDILDKQSVKDAETNAKDLTVQEKKLEKLEQVKSNYQKKLAGVNSSFSNLTEYKDVQNAINNLTNADDVNKVDTAFSKLEKVINDFKQNVKSTASLDPVFAAIKKQGNLDNIVEKYRLEFEKLGYSTDEATEKVKRFQDIANKINKVDLNSDTGMKTFGEELNKFNAEEDRLKNILEITKQRQSLQEKLDRESKNSYNEQLQVFEKYGNAQKELNKLLGQEAKQGKSAELDAKIDNQKKVVEELRLEAIEASKAITQLYKSGVISKDQKRSTQSLFKDIYNNKIDSSSVLSGILTDEAGKHTGQIDEVIEKYKKLGLTTDEINVKLKSLRAAQTEVNRASDGSVDERIQKELEYKNVLSQVENDIVSLSRKEQDRLRQNKADKVQKKATDEETKANKKAYNDQYKIIENYSKAQDELNKLLGQEVKKGQSDELTAKIDIQKRKVAELKVEAKNATDALREMSKAGINDISHKKLEDAQNLYDDTANGRTDSFKILAGIKSDKSKKNPYEGLTDAFENELKNVLSGTKVNNGILKSVSVDNSGKTTITFLEAIGDKAREVKYVLDDANEALDRLESGSSTSDILNDETSSKGKWRKLNEEDVGLVSDDENYRYVKSQIDAIEALIKIEDKYQKMKALSEAGQLSANQQAEFVLLGNARDAYNEIIKETIKLNKEEKESLFGVANGDKLDELAQAYEKKQREAQETHDAYYNQYKIGENDPRYASIKASIEHTEQLIKKINQQKFSGFEDIFKSAKIQIESLNKQLETGAIDVQDYNNKIKEISKNLESTVAVTEKFNLDAAKAAMNQYADSIDGVQIREFDEDTGNLNLTIKEHGQILKQITLIYDEVSGSIKIIEGQVKETDSIFKSLGSSLKSTLNPFASYLKNMIDIQSTWQAIKKGVEVIRELDVSLTQMRKVSDESLESLKQFQDVSFDIAGSIGTTAQQIQNSTADYMRLGYDLSTSSQLAKDANIYANVGDMDIDTATEHMISSIQAWKSEFGNEVEASSAIVDRYNEIGL